MSTVPPAKRRRDRVLVVLTTVLAVAGLLGWKLARRAAEPAYQGRPVSAWVADLRPDVSLDTWTEAVNALRWIGPVATNHLLPELTKPDSPLTEGYEWLGRRLKQPRFLAMARRRDEAREGAAEALMVSGADPRAFVPELIVAWGQFRRDDDAWQSRVHHLLVKAGLPAVAPLFAAMPGLPPSRVASGLHTVGHIISADPARVTNFIAQMRPLIRTPDPQVHNAALRIAALAGPAAAELVPDVVAVGTNRLAFPLGSGAAASALGEIAARPDIAVPALAGFLESSEASVRREGLQALARFGPAAAAALPGIVACLEHPSASVRLPAMHVLRRLGPAGAVAVDRLLEHLDDPDPMLRSGAARALGRIEAPPARAVPALTLSLADAVPDVRRLAAESLGRFGPAAAPALPELKKLLGDGEIPVRLAGIEALGRIGPAARAAVPELHAARNNDQSGVGAQVLEALARIEGQAPPPVGGWDAGAEVGR